MNIRFSRAIMALTICAICSIFLSPALAVAQESSVSVGVGDATEVTLTAPLKGDLSLVVSSTRQTVTDEMASAAPVVVSHISGGVRYARPVHQRITLFGDVGLGGWFGDGVVNPREVWRNIDFRLGGKLYVTDSWGISGSGGYRRIGENFEIQNLIMRPSETPWAVSLFGEF